MPRRDDTAALAVGLAQIRETGYRLHVAVPPVALQLPQDEATVVTDPVHVQGLLTKMAEQVYFKGSIRGVVTAPCSRCLDIVRTAFEVEIQVVFLPPTSDVCDVEGGSHVADEFDLYTHNGVFLDLQPLARDQVVLSFPVQPLCQDGCAGLCQVCGSNRNREACICEAGEDDSRFAALRQLRLPESS